MTIQYEGKSNLYLAFPAQIIDNSKELAWAEKHVVENDHFKYILGRYVEADKPNRNRQHFTLAAVEHGKKFLQHAPLNINHDPVMVGTFLAAELVYPTGEASAWKCEACGSVINDPEATVCPNCGAELAQENGRSFTTEERDKMAKEGKALPDGSFPIETVEDLKNAISAIGRAKDRSRAIAHIKKRAGALGESNLIPDEWAAAEDLNPHLEALAIFWKHYFEEVYPVIEAAYKGGQLAFSMEALPETVGCTGDSGCGQYYQYKGRVDASYCDHINNPQSGIIKDFTNPRYTGGALIVPPVRPGWANADITQMSKITAGRSEYAEHLYAQIEQELPDAESAWWEQVMEEILKEAELNA